MSLSFSRFIEKYTSALVSTEGESRSELFHISHSTFDSLTALCTTVLEQSKTPGDTVSALNRLIFKQYGISFKEETDSIRALFPQAVLRTKRGSCLGISMLYCVIGERCSLPLYGVIAPQHFFVRFDNGDTSINIEMIKAGRHLSNTWYRNRFDIDSGSWYTLENLTRCQVQGVFLYNLGNILRKREQYSLALQCYTQSIDRFPLFPHVYGNAAITYSAVGKLKQARTMFEKAVEIYPELSNLRRNYASLLIKMKKFSEAETLYHEALKKNPDDPYLHYGLGYTFFEQGRLDSARLALQRATIQKHDFAAAYLLLARIYEKTGDQLDARLFTQKAKRFGDTVSGSERSRR
jgi:regulator of sirC expression with transglutaminase-like and TPR domain